MAVSTRCPCCNGDLSNFDPLLAAKNVVISGMIDSLTKTNAQAKPHAWRCEFTPISSNESMGELKLMLEDSTFPTRPSLFIAVLDRSGSMSGRPGEQVLTALKHIESLAAINDQVKLVMLSYGSDCIEIERASDYKISGGTNFRAAFQEVDKVLRRYFCSGDPKDKNALNNVSSVVIAFLTDGEDGSGDRNRLVPEFREMLRTRWGENPVTVHAIGFGTSCDRNLLEGMREAGTLPGMFRYADQNDDDDLLCSKLTGVFETSSKNSCVPLTIQIGENTKEIQFPINSRQYGEYSEWIALTDENSIAVKSLLEDTTVTIDRNAESPLVMDRWVARCVDLLASKLLDINNKQFTDRIRHLQCALLQLEVDALYAHSSEEATHSRLGFLTAQIQLLKAGKHLHAGKLSDMRFSSAFSEKVSTQQVRTAAPVVQQTLPDKPYFERPLLRYGHNNEGKERNKLQGAIMNHFSDTVPNEIEELILTSTLDDILHKDVHGNNTLMLASYAGLSKIVLRVLEKHPGINLEETNRFDETALTLSIKRRGFHHTLGVLLDAGAVLIRKASLERYAIDNGYTITAEIIGNSSSGALVVDETMTDKYIRYVFEKAVNQDAEFNVQKFLDVCLAKQMEKEAQILLDKYEAQPTIDMLLNHCMPKKPDAPDTDDYLRLAKMLIRKNPELVDAQQDESGDTPLITAVRKGSLPHVQYFISIGASIEKANEKGNTPLWVASFMRYPCIITELVNHGADVNRENLKGNPPLYGPCCRGVPKVAEQLISYGADVFATNKNGDTLILLCCRNGQHETLQYLLDFVDEEFVNFKAQIDGFNAIMACAEQNRGSCIRVLHEYGVDLNQKTDSDNQILAEATPLHIACYYGRCEAASVLLQLGADVNAKDAGGNTPLHLAVMQGYADIIKILRYKASLNEVNNAGNPPMAYCRDKEEIRAILVNPMLDILMCLAKGGFAKEDETEAIKLLTEFKDIPGCLTTKEVVDVFDHDGSTPLQQATVCGNYNLANVLCACNADPRIPNAFGMNCITIAQWTRNRRILQLFKPTESELASPQYERLTTVQKSDPQHASVLFLGRKPEKYELYKSSGISQRMESLLNTPSFETNQTNDILTIEASNTQIQTYFQAKDAGLKEIGSSLLFWEAKFFVINKVAAGEKTLSPPELLAIAMFVNNSLVPQILNSALLRLTAENQMVNDYNRLMMSALRNLPVFNAECFIGSSCVDRKLFLKGTEFHWQHFVSSSVMWKVALENTPSFTTKTHKGVIFIVKAKTARLVQDYSPFPSDVEVLILPGTRFKVTNWYHGDVIALGQENIREHTFGVKDFDDERLNYTELQNSDKAIIIEISEI